MNLSNLITKIIANFKNIVIIVALLGTAALVYRVYNDYKTKKRLHTELIGQQEAYEQLNKYAAKLKTQYEEQKTLKETADKRWAEVVRKSSERVKMLSDATFLIGQHYLKTNGPDYFFETPKKTRNYVFNEVRIAGKDSPPIGFVMIKNDGRTYKGTYKWEIRVNNLQTIDEETGRIKVYAKAFLVSKTNGLAKKRRPDFKKWKDKEYPLPIIGGSVIIDPTVKNTNLPRFYLWNPKFNMTFSSGVDSSGFRLLPGLDANLMSYGVSKNDSKFKFFGIGVNLGGELEDFDVNFKPIYYRPFDLLSNTYLFPGIGLSNSGIRYLLGIGVEF